MIAIAFHRFAQFSSQLLQPETVMHTNHKPEIKRRHLVHTANSGQYPSTLFLWSEFCPYWYTGVQFHLKWCSRNTEAVQGAECKGCSM